LGLGLGIWGLVIFLPQGSGLTATLGCGTESRWDSGQGQAPQRCRPHRAAREGGEAVMNTPVKWLVVFWKLEKEAGKMLEGLAQ
jgi:hypothetical protein